MNKKSGKYICYVSGYSYQRYQDDVPIKNTTIIQNIDFINESIILLDVTIGNKNLPDDTVKIKYYDIEKDSIYFNNYSNIISGTSPIRALNGSIVKNKIRIHLYLTYNPYSGDSYTFQGIKKSFNFSNTRSHITQLFVRKYNMNLKKSHKKSHASAWLFL